MLVPIRAAYRNCFVRKTIQKEGVILKASRTSRGLVSPGLPLLESKIAAFVLRVLRSEAFVLLLLLAAGLFVSFYNLRLNPRPWNDEGAYLSLAKTLAREGIYAVRTSTGYETFGAVQSVGPTLIVPIALSFRLFGTGIVQGRLVTSVLLALTLVVFYLCGRFLFGRRAAIFAVFLLVASPAAGFLAYGRSAFGDVPALGFFLAGWLLWALGSRRRRPWLFVLAGLMLGLAMVTKSQYVLVGFPTLGLLALLDLLYYRQGYFRGLVVVGLIAAACFAAWWGWQIAYFGLATFQQNAAKASQLAAATTGLTGEAIKTLIGPTSGYFYFYWGFVALPYAGIVSARRTRDAVPVAFLWIFAILWLAVYLVLFVPTTRYSLAAAVITALFVGKLASDLLAGLGGAWQTLWHDLRLAIASRAPGVGVPLAAGALVAVVTLGLLTAFQLQRTLRSDVLDRTGYVETAYRVTPSDLSGPARVAAFLNQNVSQNAVVETWERELSIYTDHRYHYPDQSLLARTHLFNFHHGPADYALGADYFQRIHPAYLVIGWYARDKQIYDMAYVTAHGRLIASIGDDAWRYDVYAMSGGEQ